MNGDAVPGCGMGFCPGFWPDAREKKAEKEVPGPGMCLKDGLFLG